MSRPRTVGAATAAVALVITATACGSGSRAQTVETGQQAFAAAYTKAQSQKSADLTMKMSMSSATGGQILTTTASGAFQWNPTLGSMSMKEDVAGQDISLDLDVIGANAYVKLPTDAQAELGGKEWLKIDFSQLLPTGGGAGIDPSQELQLLQARADSVTKVGTEQIDGITTTEYRAEMDLSKAYGSAPLNAVQRQVMTQYQSMAGTTLLPINVWIDSSGLPRQVVVDEDLVHPPPGATSQAAADYPLTMAITEDFHDYGVKVTATAPPAREVSSLTLQQLLQKEQSAGSGS